MRRCIIAPVIVLALALAAAPSAVARGATTTTSTTGLAAAPASSLIGHWPFDEGSGTTAADSSGGGHPLTLQGGASWTTGVVGPHALSVTPSRTRPAPGRSSTPARVSPSRPG